LVVSRELLITPALSLDKTAVLMWFVTAIILDFDNFSCWITRQK